MEKGEFLRPLAGKRAWMAMLPGKSDISSAIKYREKIFTAVPDPKRTEPYKLRGKKV